MADNTAVNSQITDAISQTSTMTQGSAPVVSLGSLMLSTSHAMALAAHNATAQQQQAYMTMQAATAKAIAALLDK